jgi:hypothetical protein
MTNTMTLKVGVLMILKLSLINFPIILIFAYYIFSIVWKENMFVLIVGKNL